MEMPLAEHLTKQTESANIQSSWKVGGSLGRAVEVEVGRWGRA